MNVPTTEVYCWTDSRTPCKRLATHREARRCAEASISAVKTSTLLPSGSVLVCDFKKSCFWGPDRDPWNFCRAVVTDSVLAVLEATVVEVSDDVICFGIVL